MLHWHIERKNDPGWGNLVADRRDVADDVKRALEGMGRHGRIGDTYSVERCSDLACKFAF